MTKIFTIQDTSPMGYEEFGSIMKQLIDKLESYCANNAIKFDLVVPILRSGGVPGSIIAINFQITKILPIQLKCFPNNTVKQLISLPELFQELPDNPNILLCETNTNSGRSAKTAIKMIRDKFPMAKIYYATVAKVFGGPDRFDGVEEIFYGVQTDENIIATKDQIRELGLREKITIFPWENPVHELNDINLYDAPSQ